MMARLFLPMATLSPLSGFAIYLHERGIA